MNSEAASRVELQERGVCVGGSMEKRMMAACFPESSAFSRAAGRPDLAIASVNNVAEITEEDRRGSRGVFVANCKRQKT